MIWCKYKPLSLDEFGYNSELIDKLKSLSTNIKKNKCLTNMAFYGIEGSGKKTLCNCFLSDLFGKVIYNQRIEKFTAKQNCSNYNIDILISKYHYEISLCGLQFADKAVLTSFIDSYFSTLDFNETGYKILVIKDLDILSKPAQYALRRKMEKNMRTVRFIFIIKNISKIEPALISRLTIIRCRRASDKEIYNCIKELCVKESINISDEKINEIIKKSENIGSVYYFIFLFKNNPDIEIINPKMVLINNLLKYLDSKKYECEKIREIISELQLGKISQKNIFKEVLNKSIEKLDSDFDKYISVEKCSYFENISNKSKKFTICLEAYIIFVFNLINSNS